MMLFFEPSADSKVHELNRQTYESCDNILRKPGDAEMKSLTIILLCLRMRFRSSDGAYCLDQGRQRVVFVGGLDWVILPNQPNRSNLTNLTMVTQPT